ncbi:hypothetical protein E2C01_063049 [Portunus trituberculatus]|uniref:Uncharacterized protein n=1 Tax=Portunus trituberculatus TaxID=210409 RepID=A0A5B7HGG8_PORTR|nr:hypothetical protein [Portunus trituberculatus]
MGLPYHRLVTTAMSNLEPLGMLTQDHHSNTEHLRALGRRVMYFSTPQHFFKALLLVSVFRCVEVVLHGGLMGGEEIGEEKIGILVGSIDLHSKPQEVKAKADHTSDLLAMYVQSAKGMLFV